MTAVLCAQRAKPKAVKKLARASSLRPQEPRVPLHHGPLAHAAHRRLMDARDRRPTLRAPLHIPGRRPQIDQKARRGIAEHVRQRRVFRRDARHLKSVPPADRLQQGNQAVPFRYRYRLLRCLHNAVRPTSCHATIPKFPEESKKTRTAHAVQRLFCSAPLPLRVKAVEDCKRKQVSAAALTLPRPAPRERRHARPARRRKWYR